MVASEKVFYLGFAFVKLLVRFSVGAILFPKSIYLLAPLTGHFISKPIDVAAVLYKHTFPFTSFARTSRAKKLQRTFSQGLLL